MFASLQVAFVAGSDNTSSSASNAALSGQIEIQVRTHGGQVCDSPSSPNSSPTPEEKRKKNNNKEGKNELGMSGGNMIWVPARVRG